MEKDYYTVKEVANLLGIAEQTIRNYLNTGHIKSEKVFYTTVITKEEVERQIELRKQTN